MVGGQDGAIDVMLAGETCKMERDARQNETVLEKKMKVCMISAG